MNTALYLNGVFEKVLDEIRKAQTQSPELVCYLQPYASDRIKLLAESPPDSTRPIRLYISTTGSLDVVSYRALVVGWEDKRALPPSRLEVLNEHIAAHQLGEKEIYLKTVDGQACVNLIAVTDVQLLANPIPVSAFVKESDGTPLKSRTRAGRWSYVYELPQWVGMSPAMDVRERMDSAFQSQVSSSLKLGGAARAERLRAAPRLPEQIEVLSREYRRNPDVVAEVLLRANAQCECCKSPAPFLRTDGSPYLEVHHRVFLANGGEDTVENAVAVCPNCHRKLHFGRREEADVQP